MAPVMSMDDTRPMLMLGPPTLSSGDRLLEKYRIDGFIGHEDGWEVYEGTGERKVRIHVARIRDRRRYLEFAMTARTLVALRHPRIVSTLAEGIIGSHAVVVTAVVPGESLEDLLSRERSIPWPEILRLGVGMLEALAVLHDADVVHGALRASSVLGTKGQIPEVRLWNIGLDHLRGDAAAMWNDGHPELGGPPHRSVDIFASGLILYRALAGHGVVSSPRLRRHAALRLPPPPIPADRPAPPQPVLDALLATLSPDRSERPASVRALIASLAPYLPIDAERRLR